MAAVKLTSVKKKAGVKTEAAKRGTVVRLDLLDVSEELTKIVDVLQTVHDALSAHDNTDHLGIILEDHGLVPLQRVRDDLRDTSRGPRAEAA